MKCITHPMEEAVGNCVKCGAGICQTCFQRSEYQIDGRPFCRKCNYATMQELLSNANSEVGSRIVKAIINAVFIGIGLWVYNEQHDAIMMCFWMGLGSLPTAWKLTTPSVSEQIQSAVQSGIERANGEFSTGLSGFVIRLLVCFLFGCILSPILLLFSIFKAWQASRTAQRLREEIANFSET